jgi:CheY-like chemotaxis protein
MMAEPITILMAEDDEEDRMLVKEAWQNCLANDLRFVADGEELIEYLHHRGKYADPAASPRPGLILLDLNMPKMDGRAALEEIKSSPELRRIPVVILTSSKADEDVLQAYNLGVNAYIAKPVTFDRLVDVIETLDKYWFQIVELPDKAKDKGSGKGG